MKRRTSRRGLVIATLLLLPVVLWLAWASTAGLRGYTPPVIGASAPTDTPLGWAWHGAVHVHTRASGDATGTLDEVAAAAARANLDFVVISEHTGPGEAGEVLRAEWIDGVLIVPAEEISTHSGHLLALGVAPHRYALGPTARQALDDIRSLGGTPFVAHPAGGESAWQGALAGAAGFEIPNLAGALYRMLDGPWANTLRASLAYPASADATLLAALAEPSPMLVRWDALTALTAEPGPRRFAILGGVDAHGPQVLSVPSYDLALRSVVTTVWLDLDPTRVAGGDARGVANRIGNALAVGRAAVTLGVAGRAPGFLFALERDQEGVVGRVYGPGAAVPADGGTWQFSAGLGEPGDYRIELLRDGTPVAAVEGKVLEYATDVPGTYRVQVFRTSGPAGAGRRGSAPWIVTNPVYLWPRQAIARSVRLPAPALPGPPATASLLDRPGWAAEADASSHSAIAPVAPGFRWQVRVPRAAGRDRYAALVWRPESGEDWRAFDGITTRLDSEREWRVALQLRTRAADGGERVWERVVPVGGSAVRTGTLWDQFRRIGPGDLGVIPGRLEPEDLREVLSATFLVTPVIMRPGTDIAIDVLEAGLFGRNPGP